MKVCPFRISFDLPDDLPHSHKGASAVLLCVGFVLLRSPAPECFSRHLFLLLRMALALLCLHVRFMPNFLLLTL